MNCFRANSARHDPSTEMTPYRREAEQPLDDNRQHSLFVVRRTDVPLSAHRARRLCGAIGTIWLPHSRIAKLDTSRRQISCSARYGAVMVERTRPAKVAMRSALCSGKRKRRADRIQQRQARLFKGSVLLLHARALFEFLHSMHIHNVHVQMNATGGGERVRKRKLIAAACITVRVTNQREREAPLFLRKLTAISNILLIYSTSGSEVKNNTKLRHAVGSSTAKNAQSVIRTLQWSAVVRKRSL